MKEYVLIKFVISVFFAVLSTNSIADIIAPIQEEQQDKNEFVTADVSIVPVGLNRYSVVISSNVNGSAVVMLDSDDTDDVIQSITILPG